MKRYIVFLLAAAAFALASAAPASAAREVFLIGDADRDSEVSILDATAVQRRLAELDEFDALRSFLADVDGSGDVTILDATAIQRELAGLGEGFYRRELTSWRAQISSLCSDIPIEGIKAGDCVSFEVVEAEHEIPAEYEVYVGGILRRGRSADRSFSFTFDRAGSYMLSVISYDPFGGCDVYTVGIEALPEHSPPTVSYVVYDRTAQVIRTSASGGTAPYQYQYTIRNNIAPLPPGQTTAYEGFDIIMDENGEWVLRCPYCDESTAAVPVEMLSKTLSYYCEVRVRDANGLESEVKRVQLVL